MSMIKIVCPNCSAEAKLSLVDANYVGPRRCWKCHEAFKIRIEDNRVTACEPMSHEEFDKLMEAKKAEDKAREQGGGISFSKQTEPERRQAPQPQQQQEFFRPPVQKEPAGQSTPQKPGGTFPPERFNTFVPVEEIKEPEKKPKKPKDPPPDRFNIFIPPQT